MSRVLVTGHAMALAALYLLDARNNGITIAPGIDDIVMEKPPEPFIPTIQKVKSQYDEMPTWHTNRKERRSWKSGENSKPRGLRRIKGR